MAEMNTGYTEAKIVLNGYDVSGLDLYNISITTGCVSDNFIGYGATYSPSCSITTSETDIFNTGDLVSVYFKIDENWVDFGTYILSNEPVTTEGQTTIQLEGYLSTVFENEIVSFSGMSEITISEALTSISIQTGIDVVLYGYEDYLGIESQLIKIPVYDMSENGTDLKNIRMSAREFIAGLSLLLGGNAIERKVLCHPDFDDDVEKVELNAICFEWNGYELFPCIDKNGVSDISKMEVIGNIFDNPELLEVEQ